MALDQFILFDQKFRVHLHENCLAVWRILRSRCSVNHFLPALWDLDVRWTSVLEEVVLLRRVLVELGLTELVWWLIILILLRELTLLLIALVVRVLAIAQVGILLKVVGIVIVRLAWLKIILRLVIPIRHGLLRNLWVIHRKILRIIARYTIIG